MDLPSVAEMLEQIQGMKVLTRFFGRGERAKIKQIESSVRDLAACVDVFYELLGPRHWIFHESLNVEEIKTLLPLDPETAEERLIDLYRDPEALRFMVMRLRRFPELVVRLDLIERAQRDYENQRYYATILVLLTVMDGFVNDVEKARRRGLHAREPDELHAWNSVVGHHMGLANAHRIFTKTTSKTTTEPLFELERHGIVHGAQLSYDNVVVATKAWNRLFAVADWAASRQREKAESEPTPTWRQLFFQLVENEKSKKALSGWSSHTIADGEAGFEESEVFVRATSYLSAWVARNYGAMAEFLSKNVADETLGKTAGMIRGEFELFPLESFTVDRLDFEAAAVCEVHVRVTIDSETKPARMRWIRETPDGRPATPSQDGQWNLYLWGPVAMLNRGE